MTDGPKFRGTSSNLVGTICPLVEKGLTDLPKNGCANMASMAPPVPPSLYSVLAYIPTSIMHMPNTSMQCIVLLWKLEALIMPRQNKTCKFNGMVRKR